MTPSIQGIESIIDSLLKCPYCNIIDLQWHPFPTVNSINGLIICHICKRWYPVRDFIVCMMPDNLRNHSEKSWIESYKQHLPQDFFEKAINRNLIRKNNKQTLSSEKADVHMIREMQARNRQAKNYEITKTTLKVTIEFEALIKELGSIHNKIIVDVGCGVGKFLKKYAQNAGLVIGIDFSYESLLILKKDLDEKQQENVLLLQADACHLPIKDNSADTVLSSQVLQHIPGKRAREVFLIHVARIIKPNKTFVITAYNYSFEIRRAISKKASIELSSKEGFHTNGQIYYYIFHYQELNELLLHHFQIKSTYGINNQIPALGYLIEKTKYYNFFDKLIQHTPISKYFGYLLIVSCIAKKKH